MWAAYMLGGVWWCLGSLLALALLVRFVLLLDLGEARSHYTARVDESHGHVLVGDGLDQV